jgi:hypothetical protein
LGKSRSLRRLALAAAVVGFVAPVLRRRLSMPAAVTSVVAWQAPLSVALAFPRTRVRDAAVYASQMWAYVVHYEMPNDDPDALLERVQVDYPVRVDRLIGFGEVPTVRLQRALGREGELHWYDTALSAVHWAWFIWPHATLAYVLLRKPERFGRSATLMAATFDAGAVFYHVTPTAPPWWAGNTGKLPHVRRIMTEAGELFWGRYWTHLYDSLSGNQLAAMPSLHFATSVMAAHVLSDAGPVEGAVGWTYAALLGFALVYLGEHYVVDLAAGGALAGAVRRLEPVGRPLARAVAAAVRSLEPGR